MVDVFAQYIAATHTRKRFPTVSADAEQRCAESAPSIGDTEANLGEHAEETYHTHVHAKLVARRSGPNPPGAVPEWSGHSIRKRC